jgi:hypothetical protein
MTATVEQRQQIIKDYQQHENDTGSPEVQIALLTTRISELTEHLKTHKKEGPCFPTWSAQAGRPAIQLAQVSDESRSRALQEAHRSTGTAQVVAGAGGRARRTPVQPSSHHSFPDLTIAVPIQA